ncbi:MAG TPA: AraC family transcriptional regulator [Leucothrix sp.]|nr:AraC family transcriptional regulator [Leucothrix sp.]
MRKQKNQAVYSRADDLGGLELLQACYKDQTFSRHVHEGYCINLIDSGAQRFYRSGANHLAPQNSIVFVNADEVHDGCKATENGWSYRAMYPTPELLANISIELEGKRNDAPWFPQAVVTDAYTVSKLHHLFTLLEHSSNPLERETCYLSTMTELISRHSKQNKALTKLGHEPLAIKRMRNYLDEHFVENISIKTLADSVELSPFYLARLFNKTVGLPPHAYQIQRRVQKAKQLIHHNVKLSDVAVDCGFTDQSHLSRHFKRSLGITPGAYQRMSQ